PAGYLWRPCSRGPLRGSGSGAAAEDGALEQAVPHHPVAPVRAAGDLAAGVKARQGRLGALVDDEAAVLVVEHWIGEDRLAEGVDAGRTVPAQHVRQRDLGVVLGDPGGVERDGGAAVGRLDAASGLAVAAAAGRRHDRAGVDPELLTALAPAGREPAALARLQRYQRAVRERFAARGQEGVAQRRRDRVAGAVADLQQALASGAAAA